MNKIINNFVNGKKAFIKHKHSLCIRLRLNAVSNIHLLNIVYGQKVETLNILYRRMTVSYNYKIIKLNGHQYRNKITTYYNAYY